MINLKISISFSFVLNTTTTPWHEFQRDPQESMSKRSLHTLPKGEMELVHSGTYLNERKEHTPYLMYCRLQGTTIEVAVIGDVHKHLLNTQD